LEEESSMMAKLSWALLVLAILALAGGILVLGKRSESPERENSAYQSDEEAYHKEGKPAPGFDIPALGGGDIRLGDLRGKVVIVDFWSVTCGPCIIANQSLQQLNNSYNRMGLEVIGISVDPSREMVERFLLSRPAGYPVGIATEQIMRDYGPITGLPQTFIVDKKGNIAKVYIGYSDLTAEEMERIIKKLLAEG
jgi:cytochrome c biogenesis protein CcmG, thiol:disulfide interchange protein DsbE